LCLIYDIYYVIEINGILLFRNTFIFYLLMSKGRYIFKRALFMQDEFMYLL